MGQGFLSVEAVTKHLAGNPVLNRVAFFANQGEFISILGHSGAGKTTLLRVMAGLERPEEGRIACGGQTYFEGAGVWLRPERRGLGMVFQDLALWPHLTVFENVAFSLRVLPEYRHGRARAELRDRVLQTLGSMRMDRFANRRPHELSGGQKQRAAFARSIVARPRLLLLDEPFSALDRQLRRVVRDEVISVLRAERLTVLHVTHDPDEALELSDRILVLQEGRVLQFDMPDVLRRSPVSPEVSQLLGLE